MKFRVFARYIMAVLLCLSFCCCKEEVRAEEQGHEMTNGENDIEEEEENQKDVILNKTKAQYTIY